MPNTGDANRKRTATTTSTKPVSMNAASEGFAGSEIITLSARGPSFNTNQFLAGLGREFEREDPVDAKRFFQGIEMTEGDQKRRAAPAFQSARGDRRGARPACASFVLDAEDRPSLDGLLERFPAFGKRDRLCERRTSRNEIDAVAFPMSAQPKPDLLDEKAVCHRAVGPGGIEPEVPCDRIKPVAREHRQAPRASASVSKRECSGIGKARSLQLAAQKARVERRVVSDQCGRAGIAQKRQELGRTSRAGGACAST